MVISLTTSRVTPDQAKQVDEFLQGYLPKVQREPGVVAIYHFHRADTSESTTLALVPLHWAATAGLVGDGIREAESAITATEAWWSRRAELSS